MAIKLDSDSRLRRTSVMRRASISSRSRARRKAYKIGAVTRTYRRHLRLSIPQISAGAWMAICNIASATNTHNIDQITKPIIILTEEKRNDDRMLIGDSAALRSSIGLDEFERRNYYLASQLLAAVDAGSGKPSSISG